MITIKDIEGATHEMRDGEPLRHFIHADCMDGMRQFPDDYFGLAIVDPPYGVGTVTYMPRKRQKGFGGHIDRYDVVVATLDMHQRAKMKVDVVHTQSGKKTIKTFGDENTAPCPEYFEELFRVSKNQIIFGGNYFLLPPSRCYVVWDKGISEDFSMAMCEMAWCSMQGNAKLIKGIYADRNRTQSKEARLHPVQKPIELYSKLLAWYAKPGDRILDTHVGSASSLIACHRAGLEYVGFEIDADYYNAARERLDAELAQTSMFELAENGRGVIDGRYRAGSGRRRLCVD